MERKLLKLLENRKNYDSISKYLRDDTFSPIGRVLYGGIVDWYRCDHDCSQLDWELLYDKLSLTYNPKHLDQLREIIKSIAEEEISDANVFDYTVHFLRNRCGSELGARLLNPSKQDKKEVDKLLNDYIELGNLLQVGPEEVHEIQNNVSVEELIVPIAAENRIPLYPRSLNEILEGGALRGQNIVIFGRPEIGKTLFLVNLIGGFLRRGFKVLYMGNEDPISAIAPRIVTRLAEMEMVEIRRAPQVANTKISERGYSNLYMKDITPGTWDEIRKDVEAVQPDVLIVDQLRHIYCGPLSKVEQMEKAAIEARNTAKKYNILCIGTTQAGDSANEKLVLEMGDIDFSNTGMQGAVDLLIGIGCNDEFDRTSRRMLSLPKNKISGKHDYFPVSYNIPINKVESL